MQRIVVDLNINADEYVRLYQGAVRDVLARALDGRSVRFPGRILRPFVTRQGVQGRFSISFDAEGRFQRIERI